MTLSIWRYSHLSLAILSFIFLLMASITGVILSFDAVDEKLNPYKVDGFDQLTLAEILPELQAQYPEILELSVDHNQYVTLEGFDEDGNDFKQYIDPKNGKFLGEPIKKSPFIEWTTSLHRSLFLHETGRFIVGVMSFLLFMIAISGTILIVKRQQRIRHFFAKINKDFFAQYFHVVAGRLLLIPIIVISLTGTYLFLLRFEVIPNPTVEMSEVQSSSEENSTKLSTNDFQIFQSIKLAEVEKIEFPFDPDDPNEFYKIKLDNREVTVNQINGKIESESFYPKAQVLEKLSLDLHTGRTNAIWAIILGFASLNILFFIYSGFVITFKRTRTKIGKNKFTAKEAEIVLLVGSENGSTLSFARKIHEQFLANGHQAFIAQMNQYELFSNAKYLLVFTSTYGLGDAPTNAKKFQDLLNQFPQKQTINYSVVGFGSRAYEDFCGFALKVDQWLAEKNWTNRLTDLKLVNDKSPEDFTVWVNQFKEKTDIPLATTPAMYVEKAPKLKKIKVLDVTETKPNDETFKIVFDTKQKFKSGDLLAIYPENDHRERLYSIGKVNNKLQLIVKLHEFGLGSQFLNNLRIDFEIKTRIIKNKAFHFPKKSKQVILIANGTGIAPFLGMIDENSAQKEICLYAGFRYENETTISYQKFANDQIKANKLKTYNVAYSRENKKQYVMDLVKNDAVFIADFLQNKGVIMVCGALAMQHDIEKVLEEICQEYLKKSFSEFKNNDQFLTDCY